MVGIKVLFPSVVPLIVIETSVPFESNAVAPGLTIAASEYDGLGLGSAREYFAKYPRGRFLFIAPAIGPVACFKALG